MDIFFTVMLLVLVAITAYNFPAIRSSNKKALPAELEAEESKSEVELAVELEFSESEEALKIFDQMLQGNHDGDLKDLDKSTVKAVNSYVARYLHRWAEWCLIQTANGELFWKRISSTNYSSSEVAGLSNKSDINAAYEAKATLDGEQFRVRFFRGKTRSRWYAITVRQISPVVWEVGEILGKDMEEIYQELYKQIRLESATGATVKRMESVMEKLDV